MGRLPTHEELQTLGGLTQAHAANKDARIAKAETLGVMLASPAFQRC